MSSSLKRLLVNFDSTGVKTACQKISLLRISAPRSAEYIRRHYNRSLSTASTLTSSTTPIARDAAFPTLRPEEKIGSGLKSGIETASPSDPPSSDATPLPLSCPGCGALSQATDSHQAGFYTRSRKAVRQYLHHVRLQHAQDSKQFTADTAEEVINSTDSGKDINADTPKSSLTPMCDRCHDLIYYSRGQSIAHPSLDDIADSISESPFKRNHVIHVVDAADFPLSLIPSFLDKLNLAKQRSQNRRSRHDFSAKPTLSFVITRSDLLGPTKEIVDAMMPYFQRVLREALGRSGQDMRLGNVHLVSAKRGWWTKEIKEDIWRRGGATWMVGKFNVGKSNLFEVLFPKASGDRAPIYADLQEKANREHKLTTDGLLLENSLLPPPQEEVPFPIFPLVSSLPGTTASPIRLPFGNGRGELVDLPGLERGTMQDFVKPEYRTDLIMQTRQNVEQHVIKPGQSLILGGGLIRITPQIDTQGQDVTVLAFPFVPLQPHVTSNEKATAQQNQARQSGIESVLADDVARHMTSVGMFELTTDVTKSHAAPLLRAGVPLAKLPFRVYATDIVIEGVGWVELASQVRVAPSRQVASTNVALEVDERADPHRQDGAESGFAPFSEQRSEHPPQVKASKFPTVEVFSPNGKYISSRPCLGAWTKWSEHYQRTARGRLGNRPQKVMRRGR